jgi:RND family efflux transporter MFP subunit
MNMPPPVVIVSVPREQAVTDYGEYTGRLTAFDTIMVRARVTGYLDDIKFKDGELVTEKEVLFEIDPRLYKAAADKAEADFAQMEARMHRMEGDFDRARITYGKGAMSKEDYEKYLGDLRESRSALESARAALATAKLNLGFTKVQSPATGRVSRRMVDRGNLIKADDTILTSVVREDQMYAYFDVDDLTYQQVRKRVRPVGTIQSASTTPVERDTPREMPTVDLGLVDEKGYPHRGIIDFVDNQLDVGTGTMRMRGIFLNEDRSLTPGLFVRIRLPLSESHPALLVTDRAIDTDQSQKVIYVVNQDNVVEKREVELGGLHDGLREIKSGLKAGERVIVDGLQRVRAGVTVEPKRASAK